MAKNRQPTTFRNPTSPAALADEEREWEEDLDRFERGQQTASDIGSREVSQEGQEALVGAAGAVGSSLPVEFGGETSEVGDALPRAASAVGDFFDERAQARREAELSLTGQSGVPANESQNQQTGDNEGSGSNISEKRMDDLLGWGEEGVNLYGDFETDMRARPGRQVSNQAGNLRLIEDVEGDENSLITDLTPGNRQGAAEDPVQFAGETGFTASGDEGATDAQMLEAMGGPPSQDTVDEMTKMARLSNVSSRMAAGDYEDIGAAEFNEAVQKLGETGEMPEVLQEGSAPIVDAFQAAAEERRPGAELPEGAPQEAQWVNEFGRRLQEEVDRGAMDQEDAQRMMETMAPVMEQQQLGGQQEEIQAMKSGQAVQEAIIEELGKSEGQGQGQGGLSLSEEISPSQLSNLAEDWDNERMRAASEVEGWEGMAPAQQTQEVLRRIEEKYPPQVARLLRQATMGGPNQAQGSQGSSEFSDILG